MLSFHQVNELNFILNNYRNIVFVCVCVCVFHLCVCRLEEQCGACFQEMAVTWYRAMVARLLFSRNNKVREEEQHKKCSSVPAIVHVLGYEMRYSSQLPAEATRVTCVSGILLFSLYVCE